MSLQDQQTQEYPPIVIKLAHASPTRWVLEGTEGTPNPIFRETPSLYRVMPNSQRMIAKSIVRKKNPDTGEDEIVSYELEETRHIVGVTTILPEEQDKMKKEVNAQHDSIWLPEGTTTIRREGNAIGTYDYIRTYQGNGNYALRPPEAEIEFIEVVAAEIAKEKIIDFEHKLKAMNIVATLRVTKDEQDGMPEYTYDVKKLAKLVNLFPELKGLESPEEQFSQLSAIAEADPHRIINSVADSRNETLMLVKRAIELQVLVVADDKAYFTEDNVVLMPFDRKLNYATQENKIVAYLQEADSVTYLNQLKIKVQAAAKKDLATV